MLRRGGLLIVVGLVLAGCNSTLPFANGVGLQLFSPEFENRSQLLETYASQLCRQAALPTNSIGGCAYRQMTSDDWGVFVNAGMYDIDVRCDAYLSWLHRLKRREQPVLKQLSQTRSIVEALMNIASASANSITATGLAFGYAIDTYTNVNSRLLYELETSTVQKLVLDRQADTKKSIYGLEFSDKPSALHALRGYLRVCMPFTIEADVNLTVVANASGQSVPDTLVKINDSTTGATALTAKDPVRPDPVIPRQNRISGSETTFESNLRPVDLARVQRYLCVPPAARFGPKTRFNIWLWERQFPAIAQTPDGNLNTREGNELLSAAKREGDCDTAKFKNFFERLTFSNSGDFTTFRDKLSEKLNDQAIESIDSLAGLRPAIGRLKAQSPGSKEKGVAINEVTPRFFNRVTRGR